MKKMSLPHVMLLVAWGVVVLSTIPHLLQGPLRAFPLAVLCAVLSLVVVAIRLWQRRDPDAGVSHGSVAVGLLCAMVIAIVSRSQTPLSVVFGLAAIALVARGLEAGVSLVMLTVLGVCLHGRIIGEGTPPPGRPSWTRWVDSTTYYNPNAMMDPTDSTQWKAAAAYGATLFSDVRMPPHDSQRLNLGDSAGPLARIWPEAHAHRNDVTAIAPPSLGRGRVGRVVAKIWVDPSHRDGYPPLGLWPGVNYVWVDHVEPGQPARAVVIAGDGSGVRRWAMRYTDEPEWKLSKVPDWANYARAHWTYSDSGTGFWVSCAMHARCIVDPERGAR